MTIVVSSLRSAAQTFQALQPALVVTFASPGAETWTPPGAVPHLPLTFNDIAQPREGLVPPSAADVDRLLTFLEGWDRASPLMLQCWAGVSRSTAAAYIAAVVRGRETPLAAAALLRARAPFATPNPLMVSLADAALGQQGEMVRAAAGIGRGAEADLGRPFEL